MNNLGFRGGQIDADVGRGIGKAYGVVKIVRVPVKRYQPILAERSQTS
jgi:hypothetical protein